MEPGEEEVNEFLAKVARDEAFQEDLKDAQVHVFLDHWTGKERLALAEAEALSERSAAVGRVFKRLMAARRICEKHGLPFPFLEIVHGKSKYEVPVEAQKRLATTKKTKPATTTTPVPGATASQAPDVKQQFEKAVEKAVTENALKEPKIDMFDRSFPNIVAWWTPQICFFLGIFMAYKVLQKFDLSATS